LPMANFRYFFLAHNIPSDRIRSYFSMCSRWRGVKFPFLDKYKSCNCGRIRWRVICVCKRLLYATTMCSRWRGVKFPFLDEYKSCNCGRIWWRVICVCKRLLHATTAVGMVQKRRRAAGRTIFRRSSPTRALDSMSITAKRLPGRPLY
jgi:hypothetical protein